MSDSPITLEWDEDGVHIRVDLDDMIDGRLSIDGHTITGRLGTHEAWLLYETVEKELGDWYREGSEVRRIFTRSGGDPDQLTAGERESFGLRTDGGDEWEGERLRELADLQRKRERENR